MAREAESLRSRRSAPPSPSVEKLTGKSGNVSLKAHERIELRGRSFRALEPLHATRNLELLLPRALDHVRC